MANSVTSSERVYLNAVVKRNVTL